MPVLEMTRLRLATELAQARAHTEELFSILHPSIIYERPIAERHRVIFYIGHLEAFDYIQICREGLGHKSREPQLDSLFQAGIDPDSSYLPLDTPADWPALSQVEDYVAQARRVVDDALDHAPDQAVNMAIEHRLMHLETLAYMFHNFDHAVKIAPATVNHAEPAPSLHENQWCEIPDGEATLGKPRDGSFGWDNEYSEHRVFVPGFRIQRDKVTNGEYLQFVENGAALPHFWVRNGNGLYLRGMFADVPLPLDWPVYVTQQEAANYAAWLGKSLPGETQYHRAAFGTRSGFERPYPWGDRQPSSQTGNFDFRRWDPERVGSAPGGASDFGVHQLSGNGWEWTSTVFQPFEGFAVAPSYPGYSANFFDRQHHVLKGGSPRTAARLLRRSFRNWFRPNYPYVYAGFRCVEN